MAVQTIEEWTTRMRIAAAMRDLRESLVQLAGSGRELQAAISEARGLGITVEPDAELELAEAGR